MKNALLFIVLVIIPASITLGCSCANFLDTANDTYIMSDFVGTVKITSTKEAPDSTYRRTYIANLKPLAIFKGKVPKKIRVAGTVEGMNWGASCEITVEAGEEWLVALRKNSRGDYVLNYCSYKSMLKSADGKNTSRRSYWQAIKHFQFLERTVPGLHREYMISESSNKLGDYLDDYEGQSFHKSSAHYLITFDSTLTIKKIEVLKGFDNKFDKNLIAFLKEKTTWEKANPRYNTTPVKDGTQHIIDIYYYEEEKKFLSRF